MGFDFEMISRIFQNFWDDNPMFGLKSDRDPTYLLTLTITQTCTQGPRKGFQFMGSKYVPEHLNMLGVLNPELFLL